MSYQIINAFEAKTHLSSLLAQVKNGKAFMITKHNHPVALLVPCNHPPKQPISETIAQLKKDRLSLGDFTVQELKEAGRK
ncbi:MAG: type II toxin-antitoxin system prevent-host-death family antitoxin [Gammaproteobacteria bacterium]